MAEFDGLAQMLMDMILIDEDEAKALIGFGMAHREFRGRPDKMFEALNSAEGKAGEIWDIMGEGQQELSASILASVGEVDAVLL